MPYNDPDGPPPERSARVRPRRQSGVPAVRPHRFVDPRFSDLYGAVDRKQFEDNYKFLREQEEEEQSRRKHCIQCLKYALRRHEREEVGQDEESEEEEDRFEEENRDEINRLMLRPPSDLKAELQQLKRESQLYISRTKDREVRARRQAVRKGIIKREAAAVRDGKKQRAFIPKRSQLKREVLAETFDKLEKKGGKGAVDKYVERKTKKRR
ncbi:hypothetical protein DPX39_090045600 [Trypanosoma brucei equiperdum]|uniref:rRNA biogenesis protein RRP36 n=1 Tax=Trypanosoma brucei equiperdum TaxID=630700 RepID=A0A3L6L4C8_9TRYP|nr:hypothetical protein DPX39_090045600 [Trypanosoma brucei equiperdum]